MVFASTNFSQGFFRRFHLTIYYFVGSVIFQSFPPVSSHYLLFIDTVIISYAQMHEDNTNGFSPDEVSHYSPEQSKELLLILIFFIFHQGSRHFFFSL